MIDMYTDIGGMEITRKGEALSFNGGLYAGDARREDVNGRFLGFLIGASTTLGPVEVALTQVAGAIRTAGDPSGLGEGRYFKTAIEGNTDIKVSPHFPLTLTLGLEKRFFNFGNGGPVSDPRDGYILVFGVESDIVDFFVSAK
jgi:hypothetical protein